MFEGNHGDLKEYKLSEVEWLALIEKYGPPTAKHGDVRFTNLAGLRKDNQTRKERLELRVNKDRYLEMKEEGMTDHQICRDVLNMREQLLVELKMGWGIPLGKNGWKKAVGQ